MGDFLDRRIAYDSADGIAAFDETPLWSARFGALLLKHLALGRGLRRDLRVLDVACGTGFPLFELASVLGPASRCVGIDLWDAALSRAALKRRVYGMDQAVLVKGDGGRLPFAAGAFDLVVSNVGVNNFSDLPGVLAECARITRRGGRIGLTTNPRGTMAELFVILREQLHEYGFAAALDRLEADEAHRLGEDGLAARLEAAGYEHVRCAREAFAMRFADGSALLRYPLVGAGFLPVWRGIVRAATPEDERAFFLDFERRLNAVAAERGELALTIPMLYVEAVRA